MPSKKFDHSSSQEAAEYDRDGWANAQEVAKQLEADYGALRTKQEKYEDAFFMDWKERPSDPSVKITVDPSPHNKIVGASRLMSRTSPSFELPKDQNDADAKAVSSKIETMAKTMWMRSNTIQGITVERELAFTGFLYDEVVLQVISTKDILAQVQKYEPKDKYDEARQKHRIAKAEANLKKTPFLFEPILPTGVMSLRSREGLDVFYSKRSMTVTAIKSDWGDAPGLKGKKPTELLNLCDLWQDGFRYVWIESEKEPLFADAYGLDFIPIIHEIPEGLSFYDKVERRRHPLLYGLIQSELWARKNLMLTILATNMEALGQANYIHEQGVENATVNVSHDVLGGIVEVEPGGKLYAMAKGWLDPAMLTWGETLNGMIDESTIFQQTLGEPIQGNPTFGANALMHQAGRLPLSPVQESLARACSKAMTIAFAWMKEKGFTTYEDEKRKEIKLSSKEIPDNLEFDVKVDIDLPQDVLQQAAVASQLSGGPDPLMPKEWTRTKILNEGQPEGLEETILKEQLMAALTQSYIQGVAQKLAQEMMAAEQAGMGGGQGMPPGGGQPVGPGPGPGGQMNPEMEAAMAQRNAASGGTPAMPGPVPPEAPMGPGEMPPEEGAI